LKYTTKYVIAKLTLLYFSTQRFATTEQIKTVAAELALPYFIYFTKPRFATTNYIKTIATKPHPLVCKHKRDL